MPIDPQEFKKMQADQEAWAREETKRLRIEESRSLRDIARQVGQSHEWVRQVLQEAGIDTSK